MISNQSMLFSFIENHPCFHHKVFFSCFKNKKFSLSMKVNDIDFELKQDFKNHNTFLKSVVKHKPHVVIMDNIDSYDSYDTFKLIKINEVLNLSLLIPNLTKKFFHYHK